jgi:hypothetical protein
MEISAHNLDIIIRANDYALYNGDQILHTPEGAEFCHKGIRLLQQIQREFTFFNDNNNSNINCYSTYCYQKDYIELGLGVLTRNFDGILSCDPFMRKKFSKDIDKLVDKPSINLNDFVNEWLPLHFNYGGSTIVSRVFNDFIHERMPKGYDISLLTYDEAANLVKNYYFSMSYEEQSAVNLLAKYHLAGIITPIFLINLLITPSEYANAVFNLNLPHFRNEVLLKKHLELLENDVFVPPVVRENSSRIDFEKVKDEALSAVEYVTLIKQDAPGAPDLHDLLKNGENYNVEYKSTLRMNLKSGKKDVNIEHASLKTIAGFLNSSGGVLLIGVKDDSSIEGIETDDFDNEDRFSLHFWNLVKSSLGQDISAFIQTSFTQIDEKTVFMVRCNKSTHPVFLKQSSFGEEFFIRMGPSSAKLDISEALQYINERFDKN